MRIRRIVDDLVGRSHRRALDILVAQLDAALDGVDLAARMTAAELAPAAARSRMVEVEHAGDTRRAALVAELSSALTTRIDREDLYRFSRSVDDVLDNLRDLVRETHLYGAAPSADDLPALTAVGEGLTHLQTAVRDLLAHPGDVMTSVLAARKCAGRVRQLYQTALARLFGEEISTSVLKRRELLRRLDIIGLRLAECADALSDAMQKRSH